MLYRPRQIASITCFLPFFSPLNLFLIEVKVQPKQLLALDRLSTEWAWRLGVEAEMERRAVFAAEMSTACRVGFVRVVQVVVAYYASRGEGSSERHDVGVKWVSSW